MPPSYTPDGIYTQQDRSRPVQIAQEVGREHGFAETRSKVDRPGDLGVCGRDDYGGNDEFEMVKKQRVDVLGQQGCRIAGIGRGGESRTCSETDLPCEARNC